MAWIVNLGKASTLSIFSLVVVITGCDSDDHEIDERIPPKPTSNTTIAEAAAFDNLVWLGESYEGLPLSLLQVSNNGQRAIVWYGEPNPPPAGSSDVWIAPLILDIYPHCDYPPERFLSLYESLNEHLSNYKVEDVRVGNANGYRAAEDESRDRFGSIAVWSGGSMIELSKYGPELDLEQAANSLTLISADLGDAASPLPASYVVAC